MLEIEKKTIRFINYLVTPPNPTSSYDLIEQINYNTILFVAFVMSVVFSVFNFLQLTNIAISTFTAIYSLAFLILYYNSRFKNKRNLWVTVGVIVLTTSLLWFVNGGGQGSMQYVYILSLTLLMLITNRFQQQKIFLIFIINLAILYAIEFSWGDLLIQPYNSEQEKKIDIIFTSLIVLCTVYFVLRFFKSLYEEEKSKVEQQNKIIEQQNEALKQKAYDLEQANEKRVNTFVNLAHETKTPLTLINNYLQEYIRKYGTNKELDVIKSAVGKLSKDIVNFFDLERINKGFNIYNHNQISDFGDIVTECVVLFKHYASQKNIELAHTIQNNIHVQAAPEALQRIVFNLIENAIKYSPPNNKIWIELSSIDNQVVFKIKDHGIGIPEELHQNIFKPYYQINSEKANFQGMGLGLSIIKKIIDELNGAITIHSNPQNTCGTEVFVRLPKSYVKNEEHTTLLKNENNFYESEVLTVIEKPFESDKPTVLVVEDNIPLLNYIVEKLQEKHNVYYACSGNKAFEKLEYVNHLDLIVSDIMMDNGNGIDFYKQVLSQKKYKHIPFIFLTAKANINDKIEGLSLGAVDYIYKPFLIEELIGKIDAILNNLLQQRKAIVNRAYSSLMSDISPVIPPPLSRSTILSNAFDENCVKFSITVREKQIIEHLKKGLTYKEIADKLFISDKTVAKHIQHIFEKTEATNKLELLSKLEEI